MAKRRTCGGRDLRAAEGWRALVARQEASGDSVRGFCQGEGVSEARFYAWRRKLRVEGLQGSGLFVPVKVTARERSEGLAWSLEIDLGTGVVRVGAGADSRMVVRVLRTLRAS